MKLLKLTLTGWGPYRDSQEIDFSPLSGGGLFLLAGATGAGKTTVFDAITFALYGEVSGSVREKDSLRSDFAAADVPTQVELSFLHRGEIYQIVRNPRYERGKLKGEGTTTENENAQMICGKALMAVGGQQVTIAVTDLLGLDYRQFKQISMIAQGEFTHLLIVSSKERTLVFRDIFQTKLYDTITQNLAGRVRQLSGKLDEAKSRMDETTGSFHLDSEEWEALRSQKNRNYEKMLRFAEADLKEKRAQREALDKQQEVWESAYKALVQKKEQVRQRNREIEVYLADRAKLERLKAELVKMKEKKKELAQEKKRIPDMRQDMLKLQVQIQDLEQRQKRICQWRQAREELTRLQERYLALDAQAKQAKSRYEEQDDRCRKASAGILAQGLIAGHPCPVCGSLTHPSPASLAEELPDEQYLEKLKQEAEGKIRLAGEAQVQAASALGVLKQVEQELLAEGLTEALAAQMEAELSVAIRQQVQQLKQLTNAVEMVEQEAQNIELALERQRAAVEQKKESLKKPADMRPQSLEECERLIREAEGQRRSLMREKEQLHTSIAVNTAAVRQLKEHMEARRKLEEVYGSLRKVERAANGSNNKKLMLEQYVLSVYFEDILRSANLRLKEMTGGRYELYRQEEVRDRRTKESMELEVLDQYTGKKRSVKTLSGGETFKAALALALGTADVVQSFAGGVQVETLFVDEGFGALDSESLSQAIETLASLGDNYRMIGIISHVEELKERIENQILIEKGNNGSRIKCSF